MDIFYRDVELSVIFGAVSVFNLKFLVKNKLKNVIFTGNTQNIERQVAEGLFDMILHGISGGRGIGRDGGTRLHLASRRGIIETIKFY